MIGAVLLQQTHKNTSISSTATADTQKYINQYICAVRLQKRPAVPVLYSKNKNTAYCCARFSTCCAFSSFLELLSIQNQPISALPLTISSLNSWVAPETVLGSF